MNPQETQSSYSTVIVFFLGIVASALVTKGVMTQDQANALIPELATVIVTAAAIGIGWWKKNQHSPAAVAAAVVNTPAVASAVVKTVNSDAMPGVKVVSDQSSSPQVIVDQKGNVRPDPVQPVASKF